MKVSENQRQEYLTSIENLTTDQDGKYEELKIILNMLPEFTEDAFSDYIFYFLLKPIEVLLALADKCGNNGNYNKGYYYEFINYLYIYIQTSILDKHTDQGSDFNSKIYIGAFYNAFLHRMTEVLNTNNSCEYVFLTIPGMQFNVNVNELYPHVSDNKRLILIKIPEQSFCRIHGIHDMMNILGHEAAHYVGRTFRNRHIRLYYFVRSYSHIFVKYLFYMYSKIFSENYLKGSILEDIEKRIFDLLILGLEERRIYLKKEDNNILIDYFAVLIPNIVYVMEKLIENNFELALTPIGKEIEDKEQAAQIISNFREIAERFMHGSSSHSTLVDSRSVLKMLNSLYEECFADIMSVLILKTSLEDYINCIVSEAEEQGMESEEFIKTEGMFRIGTVILCLYDASDTLSGWKKEFNPEGSESWIEIARNAVRVCYSEESACPADFENDVYAFVASKKIFDELYSYLDQCVKKFSQNYGTMQKKIRDIRKTYDAFAKKTPSNGETQMAEITRVIEEYRDYFLEKYKF